MCVTVAQAHSVRAPCSWVGVRFNPFLGLTADRTRENIKAFLNAFSKKFRARSKASHSSYRHYLKRKHFTSASLSQLPPSPYRPPFNA